MVCKTSLFAFFFFVITKVVPGQALVLYDSTLTPTLPQRKILLDRADSLRKTFEKHPRDTIGAMALVQYASTLRSLNNDSAAVIFLQAQQLCEKLRFYKGQTEILSQLGGLAQDAHQYDTAIAIYQRSYNLARSKNMVGEMFEGSRQILNLYFYLGRFAEAMTLSMECLRLAEDLHDRALEGYYINLIGFIYFRQNDLNNAERYYDQYLDIETQLRDSMLIADGLSNLAEVYTARNLHEKALDYFFKSYHVYQRLNIRGELWKKDRLGFTLFKIGCAFKAKGDLNNALKYCLQAIQRTYETPSNKYDIASFYIYTGDVYRQLKDLPKAIAYLRAGLHLSQEIKHNENIRDAYHFLALAFADKKQFDSAFHYNVLYGELERKIVNEHTRREIEQINASYAIEKKDREIQRLQEQKQFSENEANQLKLLRNAIVLLAVFLLALIYLLYNRYRLKQKNKFQSELNLYQNRLFHTITTFQDQERKRIAQDIHDSLGSILSAAKLRLSGMESGELAPAQKENYQVIVSLLDEAVTELRNISHNIMPATLSRLGLEAALRNLFEKISNYSELKIHYHVHGLNGRLKEDLEIMIYRIVLELVNNVVKHAKATDITVQLVRFSDHVNVTVEDNGVGFDVSYARRSARGVGLANIYSRIESLNGKIEIDSAEQHGAIVMLDIPLS